MLTESDQPGVDASAGRARFEHTFSEKKIAYPVVLWNPYYKFEYFGDVEGAVLDRGGSVTVRREQALKPGDPYYHHVKGMITIKIPVVLMVDATMPSWLVLFHELGHVKQYYESGGEAGWNKKLGDVAAIEADNLKRHENPICRDLKLPIRAHYKHMSFGFTNLLQMYASDTKKPALIREPNVARLKARNDGLLKQAKANELKQKEGGVLGPKIAGYFVKK